jgi:hypothetical protein
MFTLLTIVSYPVLAETPIVTYDQQHELLTNNNPEPLLSVYANGNARAVYPKFMKKAGVYEWQLSDSEIQALRRLIGKPSIQQFDEQVVKEEIETKNEQDNNLPLYISDSTTTVIDVKNLNASGEVIEGGVGNGDELMTIAFEDVPEMAEENPEVTELGELQTLQSQLEAILDQASPTNRIN